MYQMSHAGVENLNRKQVGFFKKNPNERTAAFCWTEQNEKWTVLFIM